MNIKNRYLSIADVSWWIFNVKNNSKFWYVKRVRVHQIEEETGSFEIHRMTYHAQQFLPSVFFHSIVVSFVFFFFPIIIIVNIHLMVNECNWTVANIRDNCISNYCIINYIQGARVVDVSIKCIGDIVLSFSLSLWFLLPRLGS